MSNIAAAGHIAPGQSDSDHSNPGAAAQPFRAA
jgi:hypothetical protein